ncbi:MAG: hypothetical protein JWO15_369 [Sphingomonadales bacterium]|nr:hypothetical protein [Sphingomonadales bacterium]
MAILGSSNRVTRRWQATALLALIGFAAPVAAEEENWRDYTFEDVGFTIQFPIQPVREEVRYRIAAASGGDLEVPATRISAVQDHTHYEAIAADLAGTSAADPKTLEYSVQRLYKQGQPALDTLVGIANSDCGRYIGFADPDGTLNYYALFYLPHNQRFYQFHASVPPADQGDHGAGASHFGLSLNFLPNATKPAPSQVWPDEWKIYTYTGPAFSIRFPGEPKEEKLSVRAPDGTHVPARRFFLRSGNVDLRVTTSKYWQTTADSIDTGQPAVEGGARWAKAEAARGAKITFDQIVGLSRAQCGREIHSAKGTLVKDARVFFPASQHWLYTVETSGPKSAPGAPDVAALFQASLTITPAPEPVDVPPQKPIAP